MNNLETFIVSPSLHLRAIDIDGTPWFIAKDVAAVLGFQNAARAVSESVDAKDKCTFNIGLCGSNPVFVNESGLYALIFRSRKPEAKTFRKWVTSKVLPAIRRNGGYMTPEVANLATESPAAFLARALVMAGDTLNTLKLQAGGTSPPTSTVG